MTSLRSVPGSTYLLFELVNAVYVRSAGEDPATVPGIVAGFINQVDSLMFELDGIPVSEAEVKRVDALPLVELNRRTHECRSGWRTLTGASIRFL